MTTGNVVMDSTTLYPTPASASSRTGFRKSKTWNGADRVPVPPTYNVVRDPVTGKVRRLRVRQKRNDEPHDYTTTFLEEQLPVFATWSGTSRYAQTRSESIIGWGGGIPAWGASPWGSNDDITLIAKLHEKVYGSDFNPGVFLAEGGQTVALIGDAARRIAMSLAYLRKGNIREAARVISNYNRHKTRGARADRALAQNVLEVQYGWRPLMQDMKDGAEFLAHLLHAPFEQRLVVRRTVEKQVDPNGNHVADVQFASCNWTVRKQIICYLSEPPRNAVLQTILHPEAVIWEKVPWSFVVDWAAPIGAYLNARAIVGALQGKYVTTTTSTREGTGVAMSPYGSVDYTKVYKIQNLSGYVPLYREVKVNRVVSTSLSVPTPDFKGWRKTASWEHGLNGISLLASASSKNPDDVIRDGLNRLRR